MKNYTLEIKWPAGGWDTVPLGDPATLCKGDIVRVIETSAKIDYYIPYETTIEDISFSPTGIHKIVLRYVKLGQSGEALTNEYWGSSTLEIDTINRTAKAQWNDDRKEDVYNASVTASLVVEPMHSERRRIPRSTIQRDTTISRKIRALDRVCSITGQATHEALEVAHILEVGKNGSDSVGNCFLLRADLHRLFDSGKLKFTALGEVDQNNLPEDYRAELEGRIINRTVFQRIQRSLAARKLFQLPVMRARPNEYHPGRNITVKRTPTKPMASPFSWALLVPSTRCGPFRRSLPWASEIPMRLEQLRENDIGTSVAWIPSLGPDAMTRLTYMHFSHLAFYYSAQQIEQLEMSTTQINQGNVTQATVGLWFMAIESYINSILRISCLVKKLSFDDIKKKELDSRIKILFEILTINKIPFYSGPLQKLEEFKRYRNELFHDRTNDTPLAFHKTSFSGNPFFANQVDVMQAAVVAMQVFNSFRHVIPKLDLMPQAMIAKEDSFFYEKLDILFSKVLSPYFKKCLSKHSLTSDLDLHIDASCLSESPIFSAFPIEVLVKAVPDEKYHMTPSQEKTRFGEELFSRIQDSITFDTKNTFKMANFYR